MGSGTKGQSSATTTQTPTALPEYQMLMSRLNQVGSQGYTPYGGELVAPTNQNQLNAWQQFASAYGSAQPDLAEAEKYARLGASPIQASAIENYSNPYQDMVTKATMNQLQNVQQANNTQATGSTLNSGGLFNDRAGVMQGQLANQESLANAQTLGGLNSANYAQALAAAQGDRSAAAQGAYTFGNLGQEQLQTLLQGAQGTLTAGQLEQQQRQALDTSNYNQWQIAQAFPYQQMSWMAGLGTGIGSQMGGTSSTTSTPAQPNPWNQALGLGMFGLGMFAKDGGRIPEPEGFADGGAPGGLSLGDTPFGGAQGYIPSAQMHMGSGAPPPPKAPTGTAPGTPKGFGDMSSSSLKNADKGAGNLYDKMFPQAQDNPIPADFGTTTGLNYDSQGNSIPTLDAGVMGPDMPFARRGGAIHGYAGGGAPDDDLEGGFDPDSDAFSPSRGMDAPYGFLPVMGRSDGEHASLGDAPLGASFKDRFSAVDEKPLLEGKYTEDTVTKPPDLSDIPADQSAPALPTGSIPDAPMPRQAPTEVADASYEPTGSVGRGRGLGDVRLPEEREERSNAMRNALMTAGMGLMASRSPWLGSAIGEAGMAGLSAYSGTQRTEESQRKETHKEALDEKKYSAQLRRMDDAEKRADAELKLKTKAEADRADQHRQTLAKPMVIDKDASGQPIYGRVAADGSLHNLDGTPYTATPKAKAAAEAEANLTGDAYVKTLPDSDRAVVHQIGQYMSALPSPNSRSPDAQRIRREAFQAYPDIDERMYGAQSAAMRKYWAGPEATSIRSFNVSISHLDTLQKAGEALQSGNTPLFNRISQYFSQATGQPAPTDFNAVRNIVGDEITKAVIGARGALGDREEAKNSIAAAMSPAQLQGVIDHYKELMTGQLYGLRQGFVGTTGIDPKVFDRFLTPETQRQLMSHQPASERPAAGSPAAPAGGAANPPPATAAPPLQAPPRPPGIPPGAGWSPSQQKWFTRDGHVYDAKGVAVQ